MRTSWPGPRPATASSSVSRRAIPTYGSRLAMAARRLPPPAPAISNQTKKQGDTRPGHIPTPPRPRPDRARPALPQELAATFLERANAQFIGLLRFQSAAIARNDSRTAQVKAWKIRGI